MFILSESLSNAIYIKGVIISVRKEEKYVNFVNKKNVGLRGSTADYVSLFV